MENESIEKRMELKAPVERVWRALTGYEEFGAWFGAKMEGPFVAGEVARGKITIPGYEHMAMELAVEAIQPQTYFSYRWHPYPVDPNVDYTHEMPTLVEFRLEAVAGGTQLTVTESGFDKLPVERRAQAFKANDGGWTGQMKNIERYVSGA